jgi:hypothetical protein
MSGSFLQLLFKSQFTSGVQMKAAFADVFSIIPGLTSRTNMLGQLHMDRRQSPGIKFRLEASSGGSHGKQ